jgi:murein DD-endopeptidase MepM/ murein hydrolase activator NlpD
MKRKTDFYGLWMLLWLLVLTFNLSANEHSLASKDANLIDLLQLKGELTQGSAVIGKAPANSRLWLNEQAIATTPEGNFFIGFDRDASLQQVLMLEQADASRFQQTLTLTKREYRLQKVNGVPEATVTPKPESLARIQQENALISSARSIFSDQRFFMEKFIAPMDAPISGVYGSQRIYNGVPKRPHFGVDYAGPVGAPVYAPASGKVTLTHTDMFYSGGTLIIDHGYGVSSSFLHLSEILVKEGQFVKQGELIAKVGKGGRASGPHLDWRMNWLDVRIDPLKVLGIQ